MPNVPKITDLKYLRKGMLDYFDILYVKRPPKFHIILLI